MIKINLEELLDKNKQTLYWLSKETGITYPSLHKILNNKTTSIKLDIIEKICDVLNCNISDLLEIKKD
ncbi:helix-turn-helix transcriptional regulator [Hathewaya histolytica]|uniref:DNA-binding protein n=1 Tax=Hathewaya histolytica TaxID=1498 RepID=A0A4U9R6Z8_HATHI|nr:helix-turn-helix transcriptional regulator [Hathewaya histolytica]VTQ86816.1 DNA-binding protein [Hathewaya histolytica]